MQVLTCYRLHILGRFLQDPNTNTHGKNSNTNVPRGTPLPANRLYIIRLISPLLRQLVGLPMCTRRSQGYCVSGPRPGTAMRIKGFCMSESGRRGARFVLVGFAVAMIGVSLACRDDPYSQRRVESRLHNISETARDIHDREVGGARQLDEADRTLRKWWQSDCARFNRRAPTIGDYVW